MDYPSQYSRRSNSIARRGIAYLQENEDIPRASSAVHQKQPPMDNPIAPMQAPLV